MSEKETKINITKIYNWSENNELIELQLQFYSKQSEHLITRKLVKSTAHNNQISVEISLRIRYTEYENIIVIVITRIQHHRHTLGEVQIDLDQLTSQKIKYYTFGIPEKVIQIQFAEIESKQIKTQTNNDALTKAKEKNRLFIQGRKQFLENYKRTQNELKIQFESKINAILHEQNEPKRKGGRIKNVNFLNSVQDNDEQQQREIEDVQSEARKKKTVQIGRARSAVHQTPIKLQNRDSINQNSPVQVQTPIRKHKLVLNTLNIVPKQDNQKK